MLKAKKEDRLVPKIISRVPANLIWGVRSIILLIIVIPKKKSHQYQYNVTIIKIWQTICHFKFKAQCMNMKLRSESDAVIGQKKCTVQMLTTIDMDAKNLFANSH